MTDYRDEPSSTTPVPSQARLQRAKRPGAGLGANLLKVQAIGAGVMLGLAMSNLITDTGVVANLKAVLLAGTASIAAYAVNRFAVEKGTYLASIGFKLAGFTSVVSIAAAGFAMFTSTFSGIVLPDVQQRRLQDHGPQLASYVGQRNTRSLQSAGVGAVLEVNSADLTKILRCELESSCISGRNEGGRGPVAKALEPLAAKAAAVVAQFKGGKAEAEKRLATLNALFGDYQKGLARTDLNVWQRQGELMKVQARIEQEAAALVSGLPLQMIKAYAVELASGISIPDRPEATARTNAVLAKEAAAITAVLASVDSAEAPPPPFPSRAGVIDTFIYLGEFASIAAIVFLAELMLPVTIWLYAFLALRWKIEQTEPAITIELTSDAVELLPPSPTPPAVIVAPPPSDTPANDGPPPRRRGRPPGPRA